MFFFSNLFRFPSRFSAFPRLRICNKQIVKFGQSIGHSFVLSFCHSAILYSVKRLYFCQFRISFLKSIAWMVRNIKKLLYQLTMALPFLLLESFFWRGRVIRHQQSTGDNFFFIFAWMLTYKCKFRITWGLWKLFMKLTEDPPPYG